MMGPPVDHGKSESKETALSGGCVSMRKRQTRSEAKKTTRSNAVNSLPPYKEMIMEAIDEILRRTRCSQLAITKTIREKYRDTLPSDFNKNMCKELKYLAENGVLVRTENSFSLATKPHANPTSNSVKMVFPSTVRSPDVSNKFTSAEIEIDDDAESSQVQEETQAADPSGSGSRVFIFKGIVQNAHFK